MESVALPGISAKLFDTGGSSRADWLYNRRKYICASDVAGLLGVSPWASPFSVWADKCGLSGEKVADVRMRRGNYMEHAIAPWFEDDTGLTVVGRQYFCESTADPLAACTTDGFAARMVDRQIEMVEGGVEMKTAQWGPDPWSTIPMQYQCQTQWQMHVTGATRVFLPVVMGSDRLDIHVIERDQGDIDFMVERAHDFHERYVLGQTPPPVDGHSATLNALGDVWPKQVEGKEVDLSDYVKDIEKLRKAKADKQEAEQREDEAKARLLEAMKDAEVGTINGKKVFTCKQQTKTNVSAKKLVETHPRIAQQLITTTTFRTLRDCAQKEKTEK